jgi:hypothetical protein
MTGIALIYTNLIRNDSAANALKQRVYLYKKGITTGFYRQRG